MIRAWFERSGRIQWDDRVLVVLVAAGMLIDVALRIIEPGGWLAGVGRGLALSAVLGTLHDWAYDRGERAAGVTPQP